MMLPTTRLKTERVPLAAEVTRRDWEFQISNSKSQWRNPPHVGGCVFKRSAKPEAFISTTEGHRLRIRNRGHSLNAEAVFGVIDIQLAAAARPGEVPGNPVPMI